LVESNPLSSAPGHFQSPTIQADLSFADHVRSPFPPSCLSHQPYMSFPRIVISRPTPSHTYKRFFLTVPQDFLPPRFFFLWPDFPRVRSSGTCLPRPLPHVRCTLMAISVTPLLIPFLPYHFLPRFFPLLFAAFFPFIYPLVLERPVFFVLCRRCLDMAFSHNFSPTSFLPPFFGPSEIERYSVLFFALTFRDT